VSQNRIERYHSEIRPKEVRMRGIKNFRCGTRFFQLRGVIHNFPKKHQTLGCTPAEHSRLGEKISWKNIAIVVETCAVMN